MAEGAVGVLAESIIKIMVDGAGMVAGLNDAKATAEQRVAAIKNTIGQIGIAAGIAFAAGTAAITKFSQAFIESEESATRLAGALSRIGAEASLGKVSAQVSDMSKQFARDDEELQDSLSRLIDKTHSVELGFQGVQVAMDLAAAKGITLEQATGALSRAYSGNTRALMMMGVTLSEGAKGMQVFTEVGNQFAGSAERWANTAAGAWSRMKTEMGNAAEAMGKALVPMVGVLVQHITKLAEWFQNLSAGQQRLIAEMLFWGTVIAGVIAGLAGVARTIISLVEVVNLLKGTQLAMTFGQWGSALSAFAAGPVAIAIAALITLIALAKAADEAMSQMSDKAYPNEAGEVNSGRILTGEGYQTVSEINKDTARGKNDNAAAGPDLFGISKMIQRRTDAEIAQDVGTLHNLHNEVKRQREWKRRATMSRSQQYEEFGAPYNPLTNDSPSHSSTVRDQLSNLTGWN